MKNDYSYMIGNQFAKGQKANSGAFKKGQKPWNKGTKGIMKSNSGSFEKGQKGIRWLPLGSITIRTDKNNKQRRFIKIDEPNVWIEYAKFVWIKHNGKIPKGYLIHHIDEDSLNDNIENLSLVTRKGHFEIHKIGEIGRKALAKKYKAKSQNVD